MKAADQRLIDTRRDDYAKALTAASLYLRSDRRIMAMPRLREQVGEIAALQAIGSDTYSVTQHTLAQFMRDPPTMEMYAECMKGAVDAAKTALEAL